MCGIAGARDDWLREQGLDPAVAMAAATAQMRWRGPDDQATEHAGGWWLGCARLAISGPHAKQPVARRGSRFVGVMNGAITNAREVANSKGEFSIELSSNRAKKSLETTCCS